MDGPEFTWSKQRTLQSFPTFPIRQERHSFRMGGTPVAVD